MIPTKIIIHASATDDSPGLEWPGIRRYHMSYRIGRVIVSQAEWERRIQTNESALFERPWLDIGYHGGVDRTGTGDYNLLMGRPWDVQGAHCPGDNQDSLGFCFVGDFMEEPPPEEQLARGAEMLKLWMRLFKIQLSQVFAHKQRNSTDCPGAAFPMAELLEILKTP